MAYMLIDPGIEIHLCDRLPIPKEYNPSAIIECDTCHIRYINKTGPRGLEWSRIPEKDGY